MPATHPSPDNEPDVIAPVKLEKGMWVVAKCPFCSARHSHGTGLKEGSGDLREYLGYRLSHCKGIDRRCYKLVEVE